jgi:hypothetical protein
LLLAVIAVVGMLLEGSNASFKKSRVAFQNKISENKG